MDHFRRHISTTLGVGRSVAQQTSRQDDDDRMMSAHKATYDEACAELTLSHIVTGRAPKRLDSAVSPVCILYCFLPSPSTAIYRFFSTFGTHL